MKLILSNMSIAEQRIDFSIQNGDYIDLHNEYNCMEINIQSDIIFGFYKNKLINQKRADSGKYNYAELRFLSGTFVNKCLSQKINNLTPMLFTVLQRIGIVLDGKVIEETAMGRRLFQLDMFANNGEYQEIEIYCTHVVFEAYLTEPRAAKAKF